jgi:hypothetical protein
MATTRTMKLETRTTRAFNALCKIGAPAHLFRCEGIRDKFDPLFIISGEVDPRWADYWNDMHVSPKITALVEKYGLCIEWNDPGTIHVFDA